MTGQTRIRPLLHLVSQSPLGESLAIGLLIFAACVLGIHTRLVFSLASIWPANALLLGILLCRPQANRPLTWLASGAAFMLADALSGSEVFKSALLNGSNLATVAGGILGARLMGRRHISTARPKDAMAVIVILVSGAAMSSLTGAFVGPFLFGLDALDAILLWFPSEFVNLAIFVPVVLAIASSRREDFRFLSRNRIHVLQQAGAILSLLGSIALMHIVGGPGASSYVVPSLLWCAMAFRPFACSIIVMLTCTWTLIVAPLGLIPLNIDVYSALDASSFRLGVSMISIGIFVVSTINAAWRRANEQLQHMAEHDSLTGLINRGAFMKRLNAKLAGTASGKTSLLMIDIDHFKTINDTYGHPMGDKVLRELSLTLASTMRQGSIVGRLGGEEFAIIVDGPQASAGMAVAERVQAAIRTLRISTEVDGDLRITASVGLAEANPGTPSGHLLLASDTALYAAKHSGRDRIVALGDAPDPQTKSTRTVRLQKLQHPT